MVGTIFNVAAILVGGLIGYFRGAKPFGGEGFLKAALGAFTVYYGLRLTWVGLNGSFGQIARQLSIAILSLMIGRIIGRLLRLQKFSNGIGAKARNQMTAVAARGRRDPSTGFKTCAALFCVTPLAILGSMQEGLSNYFYPLVVKGVIEGLAAMGFIPLFGWGTLLSAIPVLAFQGSISLACSQVLIPWVAAHKLGYLVDEMNVVGGLLLFCVGLIIFALKKIEVADYLPALLIAPFLAWLW